MAQGVADFAVFMIYVAVGVGVLAPLFIKNKSYKTVDRGALLISPNPLLKLPIFIMCLGFGVMGLFDEGSHLEKYNGKPIPCFYHDDIVCSQEAKSQGVNLMCFEKDDPRCIDGYLQRNKFQIILGNVVAVCSIFLAFITLIQKGIRIEKDGISKEWEVLPFRHAEKIKFDEMTYGIAFVRGVKIIKIRGENSKRGFGAGFLYSRKDVDFLETLIFKKLVEISEAKDAARPA